MTTFANPMCCSSWWHDVANVCGRPRYPSVNHRRSDIPTPIVQWPRRIDTHEPRQHPCRLRPLTTIPPHLLRGIPRRPGSATEPSRIDIDIDRGQVTSTTRCRPERPRNATSWLPRRQRRPPVTRDEPSPPSGQMPTRLRLRTVDAHIRRLRKKLSILPDLISTIRGQGYRFNSPSVRHPPCHPRRLIPSAVRTPQSPRRATAHTPPAATPGAAPRPDTRLAGRHKGEGPRPRPRNRAPSPTLCVTRSDHESRDLRIQWQLRRAGRGSMRCRRAHR